MDLKVFRCIIVFFIFTIHPFAYSQETVDFSDKKKSWVQSQGNQYFDNQSYLDAIPFYEYLLNKDSENNSLKYKLGICYLYKTNETEKSLSLLKPIYSLSNSAKKFPKAPYYLARAHHQNKEYQKAVELYQEYQAKLSPDDEMNKQLNLYKKQCNNGMLLSERDKKEQNSISIINPLNTNINSSDYEYMPIITANEDKLIFTYRGPKSLGGKINMMGDPDPYGSTFDEDIYYSEKINDSWTPSKPISELNTTKNDAAVALSPDGQTLIMYRNTPDSSGNLYITKLKGETWEQPQAIPGFINTEYWEGSACISYNGNMLIFSSDRPGGIGGRDLYFSKKLPNGKWGLPINMGPAINSSYDEDSPFLFFDGSTLYYSTNGEMSIGGYDMVYSVLLEDSTWSNPVNIGTKVNQPFDDKFYTLIANGNKAFYSSMKKGGAGLQDIYEITPGHYANNQAFVLKGKTFLNDKIGETFIEANTDGAISEQSSEHYSNSVTGKYLLVFPAGWKYNITFSADGYRTYIMPLDIKNLSSFKDSTQDVHLYSDDMFDKYMNISGVAYDSTNGNPISGVKVILSSTDGTFQMETTTDANGNYIFRKVPKDKEYTIYIDYNGGNAKLKGRITDLYNQEGISNKSINGKLTDKNGNYDVYAEPSSGTTDNFPIEYLIAYNRTNLKKNALDLDVATYQKILSLYGNSTKEGLVFRVQVGAYKRPKHFKKSKFEDIDKVESKTYNDKLTRFTVGTYLTLNQAEKNKKLAQKKPPHDAFITIFYKGERMLMSKEFIKAIQ